MNGNGGFSGSDLAQAIMAGNQVAMQWYAVTHQQQATPSIGGMVIQPTTTGGYSASFGTGSLALLLILGVVVVIAVTR